MIRRLLADCIDSAFRENIRETCARQDASRLYAWVRLGALLLLAMALAGCDRMTQTVTRPTPPLAVICDEACKAPCPEVAAIRWQPPDVNSGEAWKLLVSDVVAKLVESGEQCEEQRAACSRCIQTIERSGRVCGTFEACQ